MNTILAKQLAYDFCIDISDVTDNKNHFSIYNPNENRRIFENNEDCFLKVASVNGKLLATGENDIIEWFSKRFHNGNGVWFMDIKTLRELDKKVSEYGYKIGQAHPFYIAENITAVDTKGLAVKKFIGKEIEQFRSDSRFNEAFIFANRPKDEIGIGAYKDDEIIGMAGATSDSDMMWQIGINVIKSAECMGIGTMLVEILKNEILGMGKLPFYGTSMSHIASQRVALKAGFLPAWTELYCEKI